MAEVHTSFTQVQVLPHTWYLWYTINQSFHDTSSSRVAVIPLLHSRSDREQQSAWKKTVSALAHYLSAFQISIPIKSHFYYLIVLPSSWLGIIHFYFQPRETAVKLCVNCDRMATNLSGCKDDWQVQLRYLMWNILMRPQRFKPLAWYEAMREGLAT